MRAEATARSRGARRAARLDDTLAALAAPARRGIIDLLRTGPKRATDLADGLSLSPPTLSKHLRILRSAGVVTQALSDEDSRVRMVSLRREPFDDLRAWIEEVEAFWEDQLAAFKAHAEAKHAASKPGPKR